MAGADGTLSIVIAHAWAQVGAPPRALPWMGGPGSRGGPGLVFRSGVARVTTRASNPESEERALGEEAIRLVVNRARSGDPSAFGELFATLEKDVARVCHRMLGGGPAAEDASGEVFLRARRSFESYDPDRPFRPWLLSIASHHCIDQLRRRSTEARLFEASDLESGDLAEPGPSPLARLVRSQDRAALLRAIEALPDKFRLPLLLRYWSELDYPAIADTLGVSPNQVGTLLFRAKRRLRERFAEGRSR